MIHNSAEKKKNKRKEKFQNKSNQTCNPNRSDQYQLNYRRKREKTEKYQNEHSKQIKPNTINKELISNHSNVDRR